MEQRRQLGLVGPLHVQIRDILKGHITDRRWRSGQPIPSETDLAREFGVSVGTMRKAIQGLELDGLVVRMQGRGTFVSTDPHATSSPGYSNLWIGASRYLPTFEALSCEVVPPPPEVTAILGLRHDEPVTQVRRKSIASAALVAEEIYVAGSLRAGSASLSHYDLGRSLREIGVEIDKSRETVRPGLCGEAWAASLGLSPEAAVLLVERVSIDRSETPVEFRQAIVVPRAASYQVAVS